MLIPRQFLAFLKNTPLFPPARDEGAEAIALTADIPMPENHLNSFAQEDDAAPADLMSFPFSDPAEIAMADGTPDDQASPSQTQDAEEEESAATQREREIIARQAVHELEGLIGSLDKMCRQSDPQFVQVGRDLTIVTRNVSTLTDTVHKAVGLIQSDQDDDVSLKRTEALVQNVFASISDNREMIDNDAVQVKNLVQQIFQCDRIREMIDRINSLFRIVRINIRIQCSARGLSDDLFEGVSVDLEHLSKSLHTITKQIIRDMNQGAKNLSRLQRSISEHLKLIDNVFQETRTVVSKALYDIRQLMHGTETMIHEADSRSRNVSEKVGEIVVSIQFHDSLSQRAAHISKAFQDIVRLFTQNGSDVTEEHMGTAYVIVDLQMRQLLQISREIKLIHERIDRDFKTIETEVEGLSMILHDAQFRQVGPQQFLSTLFHSLENTLLKLTRLLADGEGMTEQVEQTTLETKGIADNLKDLQEKVAEIREETRVQAVNTIIMASSLGQRGKTIEVLAKEIQTLSDQSGVLADDVWSMYKNVDQTVEDLLAKTNRGSNNKLDRQNLTAEIQAIKLKFGDVMEVVADITRYIDIAGEQIGKSRSSLFFLDNLEIALNVILSGLDRIRVSLAPWEGKGTHDSEEIEQLIRRYSMEQERMIHMFDRVDMKEETDEVEDVLF